jgi:hypothetical protein
MTDYDLAAPSRVCAATGRALNPGDRFFTALVEQNGRYVRNDYAAAAWTGPTEGTVAFWAGRVPATDAPRKPTYNDELLVEWFQHLKGATEPHKQNVRYVLALLLMRRKRLKWEDQKAIGDSHVLIVRDARTGTRYDVPDPHLNDDEIAAVQDEVFQALGWQ